MPQKTKATATDRSLAFILLFQQEYRKNPKLTLPDFIQWVHAEHLAKAKAAKAKGDADRKDKK